jgi:excisionase family DNA binding protein
VSRHAFLEAVTTALRTPGWRTAALSHLAESPLVLMLAAVRNTLLSVEEAADMLRLSKRRVQELVARGQLPAIKIGRTWVIDRADAEAFDRLPPGSPGKPRKLEAVAVSSPERVEGP